MITNSHALMFFEVWTHSEVSRSWLLNWTSRPQRAETWTGRPRRWTVKGQGTARCLVICRQAPPLWISATTNCGTSARCHVFVTSWIFVSVATASAIFAITRLTHQVSFTEADLENNSMVVGHSWVRI